MKKKALALLSGGLDSTLAIKVVLDQGIDVEAVNFMSPFCQCNRKNSGCGHEAKRVSEELKIPLHFQVQGADYIKMLRHPKFGYGKNMNPCQDCRIFMLRQAKELMKEIGATFLITGEVLGQRPMSQHRAALNRIEAETELAGLILRPLSAQALPPTLPEQEGIIDRAKLLAITGRSRKPQIELAAHLGIHDYPCPAGGCLLTDKEFCLKLKDAFNHGEDSLKDMRLLRVGRHLRLPNGVKIVVGREEAENNRLSAHFNEGDVLLSPVDISGPTVLLRQNQQRENILTAAAICLSYTKATAASRVSVEQKDRETEIICVQPFTRETIPATAICN